MRPPTLSITVELEGPVAPYPVCDSQEEEERLALEVLHRADEIAMACRVWAEATLEAASHDRRAA